MPAVLKEAYKSPFHRSNPASQFYNLSSYTRSSSTDSLRNEVFQSDFNDKYQLGGISQNNPNRLPRFNPHEKYPALHPTVDRGLPDYRNGNNDTNSSSTSSLIRDVHQGAGWPVNRTPTYLSNDTNSSSTSSLISGNQQGNGLSVNHNAQYLSNGENYHQNNGQKSNFHHTIQSQTEDENECDNLIDKVLSNNKCRRMLKKLLNDDDEVIKQLPPFRKVTEGFSDGRQQHQSSNNSETLKTILIYSLGGLLILCILDLFIKLGKLLSENRFI